MLNLLYFEPEKHVLCEIAITNKKIIVWINKKHDVS